MNTDRNPIYLESLVRELCQLPHETEWAEFKVDNADPQELGEYLSALANAAALSRKAFAYVLWGVEDTAHRLVGTTFSPATARKGNEALESWLLRLLAAGGVPLHGAGHRRSTRGAARNRGGCESPRALCGH